MTELVRSILPIAGEACLTRGHVFVVLDIVIVIVPQVFIGMPTSKVLIGSTSKYSIMEDIIGMKSMERHSSILENVNCNDFLNFEFPNMKAYSSYSSF